ncbi:hypothetical protein [Streptomyces antimycoticus]|uniref:hypothetical protein n=1 Tax=Streptomyces antimycoticus TaxID=68175 RepID=UPI0033EE48D4
MTSCPTSAERAALKVAQAATMTGDASYDLVSAIVFALGSAQLLQSPETAAEQEQLRKDRDAFCVQRNGVFRTNERLHEALQEEQDARLRAENDVRTLTRERDGLRARVAELGDSAPSQVVPVVDDVPVPVVLTEMDGPAVVTSAALAAAEKLRRTLALPGGERP